MANKKYLQGRATELVAHFAALTPPVFTVSEAATYLGLTAPAATSMLGDLVSRGWIVRHRSGVFEIAPLWATPDAPYQPDRFAALTEWVREPYYVAFQSACEIRDWTEHPVRNRLWIAVPRTYRWTPTTARDRIRFVEMAPNRFTWGITKHWVGERAVPISDPERTILDCLHLPRHGGGISEVGRVLRRAWSDLDEGRLLDHADLLGIDAVRRRLGLLIDVLNLPNGESVTSGLREQMSHARRSPVLLDPDLPVDGPVDRAWGVRVNVGRAELAEVGQT